MTKIITTTTTTIITKKVIRITDECPYERLTTREPQSEKDRPRKKQRFSCRCGSTSAIIDGCGDVRCSKCNRLAPFIVDVNVYL